MSPEQLIALLSLIADQKVQITRLSVALQQAQQRLAELEEAENERD